MTRKVLEGVYLKYFLGILVTSQLPVTIHVASVERAGYYQSNTPDAYLARPISNISSSTPEYFLAGYHDMQDDTAPM